MEFKMYGAGPCWMNDLIHARFHSLHSTTHQKNTCAQTSANFNFSNSKFISFVFSLSRYLWLYWFDWWGECKIAFDIHTSLSPWLSIFANIYTFYFLFIQLVKKSFRGVLLTLYNCQFLCHLRRYILMQDEQQESWPTATWKHEAYNHQRASFYIGIHRVTWCISLCPRIPHSVLFDISQYIDK